MCSFIFSSTISSYFIIVVNNVPVPFQNGVKYVVECHMIYYQKRKSTRKISISKICSIVLYDMYVWPCNVNKRQKIQKGQSKIDNPKKLATWGKQDEDKEHTICCTPILANKHK